MNPGKQSFVPDAWIFGKTSRRTFGPPILVLNIARSLITTLAAAWRNPVSLRLEPARYHPAREP